MEDVKETVMTTAAVPFEGAIVIVPELVGPGIDWTLTVKVDGVVFGLAVALSQLPGEEVETEKPSAD